jgi:HlyD family secretion protein
MKWSSESHRGAAAHARNGAISRWVLVALALVGVSAAATVIPRKPVEDPLSFVVESVKRAPLEITITERGNLESSNSVTLACHVEGEAGTGILEIVPEGSRVEKDQVVIKLDASKLRNDAAAQQIVVEQAIATLKTAEKDLEIQKTQKESDIATAKLKLELAVLDLDKFKFGEYEQDLSTLDGDVELATADHNRAKDRLEFIQRLERKGYARLSELEIERNLARKAEIAQNVANKKKEVLTNFTYKRKLAELQANAVEFAHELKRVELKADAALAKKEADVTAAQLKFEVEKSKLDRLRSQIEMCVIRAPRDGLAVYINTRPGGGHWGSEPLIYPGAKVKELQGIVDLPDFNNMQVNARIHESKIAMVREGLPVTIRIDAHAGETYHGTVALVSPVAASSNWPNFNLKEYVTIIKITDETSRVSVLKPGETAEIEILVEQVAPVLQAPVQSFVERGGRHFAWLLASRGPVRREVELGRSNDQFIEVVGGLTEGDKVVLAPRNVLPKEVSRLEEELPIATPSPDSPHLLEPRELSLNSPGK